MTAYGIYPDYIEEEDVRCVVCGGSATVDRRERQTGCDGCDYIVRHCICKPCPHCEEPHAHAPCEPEDV